jgi:hypothetical protein
MHYKIKWHCWKKKDNLASHLTFVTTTGHLTQKQDNPIENRKSGHPKLACPYRKIGTEISESVNVVCDCYVHLTSLGF